MSSSDRLDQIAGDVRRLYRRTGRLVRSAWPKRRRLSPVSDHWGFDRGTPIDRYYIDSFLREHSGDIHGRCVEVRDTGYIDRFGIGVTHRDVIDMDPVNERATFVTDIAAAHNIPSDSFDCFVLTQTLQFVADPRSAADHIFRFLAPGGIVLLTVPCISRVARTGGADDRWRFTEVACRTLFEPAFGSSAVATRGYGNVFAAKAFLDGRAAEELSREELDFVDDAYPVIVAARAVKASPL